MHKEEILELLVKSQQEQIELLKEEINRLKNINKIPDCGQLKEYKVYVGDPPPGSQWISPIYLPNTCIPIGINDFDYTKTAAKCISNYTQKGKE